MVGPKEFLLIGNNLAVDFVNTQVMNNGSVVDLLDSKGDLLEWVSEAGILSGKELADEEFLVFKELRTLLKAITDKQIESEISPDESEVNAINGYLQEYKQIKELRVDSKGATILDK